MWGESRKVQMVPSTARVHSTVHRVDEFVSQIPESSLLNPASGELLPL